MKCKAKGCGLESGHPGKCCALGSFTVEAMRNPPVTTSPVTCNRCVTKEAEIERLRNQIAELESKGRAKPKRDRAGYMRKYRAGGAFGNSAVEKGTPQ